MQKHEFILQATKEFFVFTTTKIY